MLVYRINEESDPVFDGNPYYILAEVKDSFRTGVLNVPEIWNDNIHGWLPVRAIDPAAAYGVTSITGLIIRPTITSIGDEAFRECTGITSLTFVGESTCTYIGSRAFYHCDNYDL